MKQLLILLLSSTLIQCQTSKKEPMPVTDFYISEHTITYKNQELPFGKPVAEWVKVFGIYSRKLSYEQYVWDSLGISIDATQKDSRMDVLKCFLHES